MLRLLITRFKKVLTALIVAALMTTMAGFNNQTYADDFIRISVKEEVETMAPQQRQCDIVIRVGEWGNNSTCKPGKRVYIDNLDLKWKDISTDIPIRKDSQGHFISEFDINKKIAEQLYSELTSRGVNAKIQIAGSKSEDLNAAGRISNKSNPKIYLSLHTNSYQDNSSGYFFMYNTGDTKGQAIAQRLSDSMKTNGMIRQMNNRENTNSYIGELNVINKTTIPVLGELGFFSGTKGNGDLYYLVSDTYGSIVANNLANELIIILNELN